VKSDTERLLEASIEYIEMKRMLREVTEEQLLLREENKMLRLRLQRLTQPRAISA
jgi:regulator of replication initiation timing